MLDRETGRAGQSLGILMLDLDHFKKLNDTCGHDAGDAVLREAAAFLLQNVRAEDFVCRFGGQEFVEIPPTADLEGSRTRAKRLRSKNAGIDHHASGQVSGRGHIFRRRGGLPGTWNVAKGVDWQQRMLCCMGPSEADATASSWRLRTRSMSWRSPVKR